jgi:hypothetical protein
MSLNNLLEQNKDGIVKQWLVSAIDNYPADSAKFMKRQKDPFANPVGNTLSVNLGPLFDELLNEMDYESITSYLYPILKSELYSLFYPLHNQRVKPVEFKLNPFWKQ